MANYTQTIGNTFNVLGAGRTNRWGDGYGSGTTLVWQSAGAATFYNYFGDQRDLELRISKGIGNDLDLSSTVGKRVDKIYGNTLDLSSTIGKTLSRLYANTLVFSGVMTTLTVKNGDWDLVFPDGTTNASDRYEPTWNEAEQSSATWTETAQTTTSWTEV